MRYVSEFRVLTLSNSAHRKYLLHGTQPIDRYLVYRGTVILTRFKTSSEGFHVPGY